MLDKPAGLSVLRDRAGEPCLWDWLQKYTGVSDGAPPRLVHRLDKGTSGVLLVARSARCHSSLARQLASRHVWKWYLAMTLGIPDPSRARIDLPLCPGRKGQFRVAGLRAHIRLSRDRFPPVWGLRPGAKVSAKRPHPSQTDYRVVRRGDRVGLVALHPLTGRTHQIRVHLAWTGWPVLGDSRYGHAASESAPRLMLHSRKVAVRRDWIRGDSPRILVFRVPMPVEFRSWMSMPAEGDEP